MKRSLKIMHTLKKVRIEGRNVLERSLSQIASLDQTSTRAQSFFFITTLVSAAIAILAVALVSMIGLGNPKATITGAYQIGLLGAGATGFSLAIWGRLISANQAHIQSLQLLNAQETASRSEKQFRLSQEEKIPELMSKALELANGSNAEKRLSWSLLSNTIKSSTGSLRQTGSDLLITLFLEDNFREMKLEDLLNAIAIEDKSGRIDAEKISELIIHHPRPLVVKGLILSGNHDFSIDKDKQFENCEFMECVVNITTEEIPYDRDCIFTECSVRWVGTWNGPRDRRSSIIGGKIGSWSYSNQLSFYQIEDCDFSGLHLFGDFTPDLRETGCYYRASDPPTGQVFLDSDPSNHFLCREDNYYHARKSKR